MSDADVAAAMQWPFWCRADQCEPHGNWRVWLVMAGRGFGKTRMGAEWVNERAMAEPGARIALIGANMAETRNVMVEGESGLLSLHGEGEIEWQPSLRRFLWPNGAQAALYSASANDAL